MGVGGGDALQFCVLVTFEGREGEWGGRHFVVFDAFLHARVDGGAFSRELDHFFHVQGAGALGGYLVDLGELALDVCEVLEDFLHFRFGLILREE